MAVIECFIKVKIESVSSVYFSVAITHIKTVLAKLGGHICGQETSMHFYLHVFFLNNETHSYAMLSY